MPGARTPRSSVALTHTRSIRSSDARIPLPGDELMRASPRRTREARLLRAGATSATARRSSGQPRRARTPGAGRTARDPRCRACPRAAPALSREARSAGAPGHRHEQQGEGVLPDDGREGERREHGEEERRGVCTPTAPGEYAQRRDEADADGVRRRARRRALRRRAPARGPPPSSRACSRCRSTATADGDSPPGRESRSRPRPAAARPPATARLTAAASQRLVATNQIDQRQRDQLERDDRAERGARPDRRGRASASRPRVRA